ncbi:MAG: hypothetical protein ACRDGA_14200, partial [Bacteroidota bacterium]
GYEPDELPIAPPRSVVSSGLVLPRTGYEPDELLPMLLSIGTPCLPKCYSARRQAPRNVN